MSSSSSTIHGAAAASAIAAMVRLAMAGHAASSLKQRAPASTGKKRGAADHGKAGESAANGGTKPSGSANSQGTLPDLIAARAESLDPDAKDYRSRLLRLVIEASLLHEFGSHMINAPKFQYMIDQVLHELESAPQLKRDLDLALKGLVKAP